jgi:hypothetical protein
MAMRKTTTKTLNYSIINPLTYQFPASLDADRTGRRRENIWMEEMKLGRLGFLV